MKAWHQPLAATCTAELSLREGEAAQRASRSCVNERGGEGRVKKKDEFISLPLLLHCPITSLGVGQDLVVILKLQHS